MFILFDKSRLVFKNGILYHTLYISAFLDSQPMVAAKLAYDAKYSTRYLKGKSLFNKKDILIISKILLENRSLNKEEKKLINFLI